MRKLYTLFLFVLLGTLFPVITHAQVKKLYFKNKSLIKDSLQADSYGYLGKLSGSDFWTLKTVDPYNQVMMTGSYLDSTMLIPHGDFIYYSYIEDYNVLSPIDFPIKEAPIFISSKGKFRNGKLEGFWHEYYPNKTVKMMTFYTQGIRNGPFLLYEYNGKLLESGQFINGLPEGEWKNARGKITYYQAGRVVPKPKHKEIHFSSILVDTHGDILYNQIKSGIDIGQLQETGHFDLKRAKEGGLDVQVFSVWSDQSGGFKVANQQIDSLFSLIKRYPSEIALVKTAKDLVWAVKTKRMAALFGVEGGHMIENDLSKLQQLADRGMTYLTLTWNNSTPWASSASEETSGKVPANQAGLNDFGIQVVKKLNELGVMVDLSHVGEKTFYDVLKVTTKPVILSHSSVYALNPVPRNVKDDQIKAVAKNGGLISLNLYNGFLDPTYRANTQAFLDKYETEFKALTQKLGRSTAIDTLMSRYPEEAEAIKAPIDLAIDHIDYIVKLVGVDYVGLGADFDGAESFPKGLNSVADYPKITEALVKRGYKTADIEKILGLNFIRVLKANRGE